MPIYEYVCDACNNQFEVKQKFSDPPIETCQACGKPVRKLISAPGIVFKGTGWYVTDYSNKLKDPRVSKPEGSTDGKKTAKHETGGEKSDTKPAAEGSSGSQAPSKTDSSTAGAASSSTSPSSSSSTSSGS